MSSQTYFAEALDGFREARRLTYDFLNALNFERLVQLLPRPDLDTFGKHIQELGDTQESYALGIRNGTMDFSTIRTHIDQELVRSKDKLCEFLENCDAEFEDIVAAAGPDSTVGWPGNECISIEEQISRLTRHEIFHHGQFAAYAWLHGVEFPASWLETWVLPRHPGELYPENGASHTVANSNGI